MKRILPWLIATAGLLFGASRIQWGPQVTGPASMLAGFDASVNATTYPIPTGSAPKSFGPIVAPSGSTGVFTLPAGTSSCAFISRNILLQPIEYTFSGGNVTINGTQPGDTIAGWNCQ